MNKFKLKNNKRGFTLFLTFMVMLMVVFSGIFSRTEQIVEIFALQKKILKSENISIEIGVPTKAEALINNKLK
jgi:hypothetical protein